VWWVLLYVALGVLSIAVLGLLTLRLWRQVRQLGRDVSAAGDRINSAMTEIEQISSTRR